jgi:Protein of unknown function (DUF3768)
MCGAFSPARDPVRDWRASAASRRRRMAKVNDRAKRIATLNDKFRKGLATSGRVHVTRGVNDKGPEFVSKALSKVIAFDDFNADNDPRQRHEFGNFELEGETLYFKLDYYDLRAEFGSEDPADPKKTLRVMTIMLAEEY